jgi:Rrf2 family protein
MKTNIATKYALLAVGYVAQHDKEGLILSNAISDAYGIPTEYLLKVMQALVKNGILDSKRGPRGGFTLARSLGKTTLLEVLEAVDGSMNKSIALQEHAPKNRFAIKTTIAYDKITSQTRAALGKIKLSELV